jgi:hypothetical protein
MSGANIPTTTNTTFNPSVLSTIATLGSTAGGVLQKQIVGKNADGTPIYGDSVLDAIKGQIGIESSGTKSASYPFQGADGKYYPTQDAANAATTDSNSGTNNSGTNNSGTTVLTPAQRGLTPNGDGTFTNASGELVDENGNPIT